MAYIAYKRIYIVYRTFSLSFSDGVLQDVINIDKVNNVVI